MFVDESKRPAAASGGGLDSLPLELIEREIEELGAQLNAGHARWLELVGEFDRRDGWHGTGCRSLSEWVAWRCALNPRAAREHVRVARALPELSLIRSEFARGALSYSKVRALTRIADSDSEERLLELARHATAAQLERIVRASRRVSAAEADELQRQAYVRWYWDDDDGSLRLDAKLPPEDGALVLRALEQARDLLFEQRSAEREELAAAEPEEERGSAEPPAVEEDEPLEAPVPSPSNAESLAALCELSPSPSARESDPQRAERYQVLLHVDSETLATDEPGAQAAGPGACAIHDGPAIAPETARRLACDAAVIPLLERDGKLISVGRRTRAVPASTRRALVARDGRCQFPGCERWRFVDAHHIHHWSRGGETSLENLILLCRHHHRLVHEGGFSISAVESSPPLFKAPDGSVLEASPAPPRSTSGRLARTNRSRGHSIDHDTCLTGNGEKMNLRYCVDAALQAMRSD